MVLMAYWKGTLIFTWHETSEIHMQWFWPLRWRRWCSSQVFSIWRWGNSVSELMLRESSSHGHLHIYITIHNTICILYIYTVCLSIFLVGHDGQFWLKKYVYCHYEYLQVDPTCCVFEVGLLPKNPLPKGQHIISIHFPQKTMFELLFMMLMFQSSSCWWCTNRFHVFVQCGAP